MGELLPDLRGNRTTRKAVRATAKNLRPLPARRGSGTQHSVLRRRYHQALHETAERPSRKFDELRDRVRFVDGDVILSEIASMDDLDSESLRAPRLRTRLFVFYALVSLALAASGLYGLLSRSVSVRTREIGIRMALGASRGSVLATVTVPALRWILTGLIVGVGVTLASARFIAGLLYGVSPYDPTALGATGFLLSIVAILACLLPSIRASAIEPARALKEQ